MSKFYSVRKGRLPGIYTTWNDCKKQVSGFSGAIHKSFKNIKDAQKFMGARSESIDHTYNSQPNTNHKTEFRTETKNSLVFELNKNDKVKHLDIYTDGSHLKHTTDYIGYGAFCKYEQNEYNLSGTVTKDLFEKYNFNGKISNPTAEFIAFHQVLLRLNTVKCKVIATFYIDYIGVSKWMTGQWKTKQQNIRGIKNRCDALKNKHDIKYKHVSGHSGVLGNDIADKMAKCSENIDEWY